MKAAKTGSEACVEALKKIKTATARELEKATGFPVTTLSTVLTDLYYKGFADRENIGTAAAPRFKYIWNETPKQARKRPVPIPRKKKVGKESLVKKAMEEAKARMKKAPSAKPAKPVAVKQKGQQLIVAKQANELGSLLDALANRIADTLVERIVSGVESRLANSFRSK